ncbi:uncharacterized protein LOC123215423 isoform X2 [Mangifera indica]|uniref:uncharacterized protein LOC123215423 isoform X2 n=1 Tax=Mangifera indica TaxID=29780 RepID=UPI001CF98538|nr:uncharacterized protein LOC123215423 isoform X2 [Mangifera indica]
MSVQEMLSHIDIERGSAEIDHDHHHRHRHSQSIAGSDASICFSDAEEGGSGYSQYFSTAVEIESEVVGEVEIKVHVDSSKVEEGEKDCRICHLGLESNSHESGIAIHLGCSCKDDLAVAHKQCAEAWFKIRGNKTCEICNSIARNVAGATDLESIEQSNETNSGTAMSSVSAPARHGETRSFWNGHRFLNFLLACVVFAFIISWLFHFNVSSS